jgi:hypothetical protein
LGTDKTSRAQIGTDLMKFFGDAVDEIHLRVPRLNEWLACVTFVDPDAANAEPTFQVVACVGSSQVANVPWTQEDKPPQIWKTHVWYEKPTGYKMIRDVKNFGAFGRWW